MTVAKGDQNVTICTHANGPGSGSQIDWSHVDELQDQDQLSSPKLSTNLSRNPSRLFAALPGQFRLFGDEHVARFLSIIGRHPIIFNP
ncbi:hypothetical protein BDDG_11803 [Blastomyces dermatitidis ATCC 18188]|uniref:Uncharacterized protein n=1 Tax=Ajellomyces dermatitidis (strain ATCC 18188 / CBS 674.68) TaxID=653446 RepID=A0A0J9HCZ6_AJEDA|nr:hypothetical protein BDDG_11803 [Blastomyces dermatitidis ATCC 18188]